MTTFAVPDFDPLNCRAELLEALRQPELDTILSAQPTTEAARQAAFALAVALGRCRLFGVTAGEFDGTLPTPLALAAADRLVASLPEWTVAAQQLGARWDGTEEPVEAEELCLETLEQRLDIWAAVVAVVEASLLALEDREPEAAVLSERLDHIGASTLELDEALQAEAGLLATAVNTELLNNWRACLAEPYRSALPWWLDGTLEAVAQRDLEQLQRDLTRPRATSLRQPARAVKPIPPTIIVVFRKAMRRPYYEAFHGADEEQARVKVLKWVSPNKRWVAYCSLPEEDTQTTCSLFFCTAAGEPATELVNRQATLDGVAGIISSTGELLLPRRQLADVAESRLLLLVDPTDEPWSWQEI